MLVGRESGKCSCHCPACGKAQKRRLNEPVPTLHTQGLLAYSPPRPRCTATTELRDSHLLNVPSVPRAGLSPFIFHCLLLTIMPLSQRSKLGPREIRSFAQTMLEEEEEPGSELHLPVCHQRLDHLPFSLSATHHHSKSMASETPPSSLSNVSQPQAVG